MVETAPAVLNCAEIAAHPEGNLPLIAGTNDLAKDMQIRLASDRQSKREGMLYALSENGHSGAGASHQCS